MFDDIYTPRITKCTLHCKEMFNTLQINYYNITQYSRKPVLLPIVKPQIAWETVGYDEFCACKVYIHIRLYVYSL